MNVPSVCDRNTDTTIVVSAPRESTYGLLVSVLAALSPAVAIG